MSLTKDILSQYMSNMAIYSSVPVENMDYSPTPKDETVTDIFQPDFNYPIYLAYHRKNRFEFNRSLIYKTEKGVIDTRYCQTDGPDEYAKHKEQFGKTWEYYDKEISYNINSMGYRTVEFDSITEWKKTIPFFGCSSVFGVGLNEDDVVTSLVATKAQAVPINFGYPAGSNDTILKNVVALIETVHPADFPRYVVIGWTCVDRATYFRNNAALNLGAWSFVDFNTKNFGKNSDDQNFIYFYNSNKYHAYVQTQYTARTVRALLKGKTKLIEFSFYPDAAKIINCHLPIALDPVGIGTDNARDMVHHGKLAHKLAAQYIIGQMK